MRARAGAFAFLLVLSLIGCGRADDGRSSITFDTLPGGAVRVRNPEAGLWGKGEEWRLMEELRIGSAEGAGADAFAAVVDLEVDQAGRIYVLDAQAMEIRVFDGDGRHLRTLGGVGEGPGEFRNPRGMAFDPAGRLWVFDPGNARVTVFDTAGNPVATHPREIRAYGFRWFGEFDPQGRLVEPAVTIDEEGVRELLVRLDPAMAGADSFPLPTYETATFEFRTERASGVFIIPFAPELHRVIDGRGHVWLGISDAYRIVRTNFEGDTALVVEKEHRPVPVSASEVDAEIDRTLAGFPFPVPRSAFAIDRARYPTIHPAHQGFLVEPDGHLWVQRVAKDTTAVLDVFDPTGRYLGNVRSPSGLDPGHPWRFAGQHLYAVVTDELDVPYAVRLRIVRDGR